MEAVTTMLRAWRMAATPAAMSIQAATWPPKTVPSALA
jgi:hypothetical protein